MKERPILFSGEMVRALLAGTKTQTRRPIVPQPSAGVRRSPLVASGLEDGHGYEIRPPYAVGDTLWVRETWGIADMWLRAEVALAEFYDDEDSAAYTGKVPGPYEVEELSAHVVYRADKDREFYWRPSIHMPRWASRITLEVTDVCVERVQDISFDDAIAEGGCGDPPDGHGMRCEARGWFRTDWDAIYAKRGLGWDANPWVWAITFKEVVA